MQLVVIKFEGEIEKNVLKKHIQSGEIPVIFTGDDLTAVEIAYSVGAERCVFYKKEGGIFIFKNGKRFKIKEITYDKMHSIFKDKAIEKASELGIKIEIRSTISEDYSTVKGYVSHL